jgi:DNA-binding MarR family transcriptional regulator
MTASRWSPIDIGDIRLAYRLVGAELATRGVTPQSMSTAIGSPPERGLVVRTPHPTRGRVLEVRITTEGTRLLERAQAAAKTVEHLDGREPDGAPPEETMAWRFTDALITHHAATDSPARHNEGPTMTAQQGDSQ